MYKIILVFLGVRQVWQVILGILCHGNENDRWGFHYGNSVMCLIRVYNLYFCANGPVANTSSKSMNQI
jgi:hypothetical protein